MNNIEYMDISIKADAGRKWFHPLQKGFFLEGVSGMSVRNFLNDVLEFDDDFVEGSVRTIFLNNSPVDGIDETYLKDGDRLALGSAMPGLVGIVMGRDNPFKSFRSDISAQDGGQETERKPIQVSVKLFSSLAVETRDAVLGRGVVMGALMLADFLEDKTDSVVDADGMDGAALVAFLREKGDKVAIRVAFVS